MCRWWSVLAINKLELKDMLNSEMIENPVLEEIEESSETLDELAGREGNLERSAEELAVDSSRVEKDPFDEIDFGSYFQDYLDPGFRTASNFEEYDKPSFEHFLAQPSTLTDHLTWQLGSIVMEAALREAVELLIGNLNEDGYLLATDEELAQAYVNGRAETPESIAENLALIAHARTVLAQLDPVGGRGPGPARMPGAADRSAAARGVSGETSPQRFR